MNQSLDTQNDKTIRAGWKSLGKVQICGYLKQPYEAREDYSQLNDSASLAESETAQFFPVHVVLPLFHFDPWVWENDAQMSLTEEWLCMNVPRKQKLIRTRSSKETPEGIAQFQDWSVRFLRQKRSLKYSGITHKAVVLQL